MSTRGGSADHHTNVNAFRAQKVLQKCKNLFSAPFIKYFAIREVCPVWTFFGRRSRGLQMRIRPNFLLQKNSGFVEDYGSPHN